MSDQEEFTQLIQKATRVRSYAFVPKSNHKIGACVMTRDGEYFEGVNIESPISGLGTCAERAAIDHAISHGKYEFQALAIVDEKITYSCGACLQYLLEFYQINKKDIIIVSADVQGKYEKNSLLQLLPHGYLTEHNLDKIERYKSE